MPARLRPRAESAYQRAQDPAAKAAIRHAWRLHDGKADAVAEALDLSRSSLYREIRRLWGEPPGPEIAADLPGYQPGSANVAGP